MAEYCFFCDRRRLAVARYRIICLVLINDCMCRHFVSFFFAITGDVYVILSALFDITHDFPYMHVRAEQNIGNLLHYSNMRHLAWIVTTCIHHHHANMLIICTLIFVIDHLVIYQYVYR